MLAWILIPCTDFEQHSLLQQLIDMYFTYEIVQGDRLTTQRLCRKRYQDKIPPDPRTVEHLHWEWFSVYRRGTRTVIFQRISVVEELVLRIVEYSSLKSSRTVGSALGVSHSVAQCHAWNACREALYWCNYICCSKFVRELWFKLAKRINSPNFSGKKDEINGSRG